MILILLYALMAQSWNVVAGLSGQISLGHAIFFGIGAYSSTVLFAKYGITPWVGLLVGMLLSALAAIAIGVPTLRLRGHYFAIATLLIGSSVQIVFQRWDWVGAASGLYVPIIAPSPWLYLQFHTSKVPYYYLALAAAAARLFPGVEAAPQPLRLPPAGAARRAGCGRQPRHRHRPPQGAWPSSSPAP